LLGVLVGQTNSWSFSARSCQFLATGKFGFKGLVEEILKGWISITSIYTANRLLWAVSKQLTSLVGKFRHCLWLQFHPFELSKKAADFPEEHIII
jgi:hypothetical protein